MYFKTNETFNSSAVELLRHDLSCFITGWLSPKPLPKLSGQFSYHEEITLPKEKAVFNAHVSFILIFKRVYFWGDNINAVYIYITSFDTTTVISVITDDVPTSIVKGTVYC